MTLDDFCKLRYGRADPDYRPTKSHRDTVSWMCRNKTLPAWKVGRRWEIDDGVFERSGAAPLQR